MDGRDPEDDSSWYLKSFQQGEGHLLTQHAKAGVEAAAKTSHSLLIFSGGQTHAPAGPISEAQSYWYLSEKARWWECSGVRDKAITEEYARDSFENVLFSICRFKQFTGRYPQKISIFGWSFKRERFERYSRYLRFPLPQFFYEGINDPPQKEHALQGELLALSTSHETGETKRIDRNPFRRHHGYETDCPELGLLLASYKEISITSSFPWDAQTR